MPTRPPTHEQLRRALLPTPGPRDERASAARRGYGARWRKARLAYLRSHPLCVECGREGRTAAATVVDHVVPHKGDEELMWDEGNWQSLCKQHHDRKTATEDGGFGRK